MTAAKFNDYLLHDGMPHVLAERMDAGELDRAATEQYSKYVKTLFRVGDSADGDPTRALGLHLEIVPEEDPLAKRPGQALRVRVLLAGDPLPGANVCWDHPGNGERFTGQTWTDADGRALVPIDRLGWMTIRLVHMTHPRTEDHEWESFWSSLTLRIDADPPQPRR